MEADWAERTIVVSGFPEDVFPSTVMVDKLTIHFLRPRNGGGEVESVIYPTDIMGSAYITLEKKEVVDSILRRDQQIFEDKELRRKYPLKISQNIVDVFSSVSVDLDSSIFEKNQELNKFLSELQSSHKILQFSKRPDGRLHIKGSFSALKKLRRELQKRIGELQGMNSHDSVLKSGRSGWEGKPVKSPSYPTTWMTEPQNFIASPSYGDQDVLDPAVFKDESIIILDADIFSYIDKICKHQYEVILRNNYVTAKPINYNNLIFLHLFTGEMSEMQKQSQLMKAKHEMAIFISQMQKTLVIEKIRLDGGRKDKTLKICKRIVQQFPKVLVQAADYHVILTGSQDDCKQFARKVEETVQTGFDPSSSEWPNSLNPAEDMNQLAQSVGSDTVRTLHVPRPIESNPDGFKKSQVDSLQPPCSWNDSFGKQGSSPYNVDTLVSGSSSFPPLSSNSLSTTEEEQSRMVPRSERRPSCTHY
ncbi:RNA-binding protein 43-like isoform X2 [Narcine bancroftii]